MDASPTAAAKQSHCDQLRAVYAGRVKDWIRELLADTCTEERIDCINACVWERVSQYRERLATQKKVDWPRDLQRLVRVAAVFELPLDDLLLKQWRNETPSSLGDLVCLRYTREVDEEQFAELWRRSLSQIKGHIGLKLPPEFAEKEDFLLDLRAKVLSKLRDFKPELSLFNTFVKSQADFLALQRVSERSQAPITVSIDQPIGEDDDGPRLEIAHPGPQPWEPLVREETEREVGCEFSKLMRSDRIGSLIESLLNFSDFRQHFVAFRSSVLVGRDRPASRETWEEHIEPWHDLQGVFAPIVAQQPKEIADDNWTMMLERLDGVLSEKAWPVVQEYAGIMTALFGMPSLPHQLIPVGLHDVLGMRPDEMAADPIWKTRLKKLNDVVASTEIEASGRVLRLGSCMTPLTERLEAKLSKLMANPAQRKKYKELLVKRGDTCIKDLGLIDFEPDDKKQRTDELYHWVNNIHRQLSRHETAVLDCMRETVRGRYKIQWRGPNA